MARLEAENEQVSEQAREKSRAQAKKLDGLQVESELKDEQLQAKDATIEELQRAFDDADRPASSGNDKKVRDLEATLDRLKDHSTRVIANGKTRILKLEAENLSLKESAYERHATIKGLDKLLETQTAEVDNLVSVERPKNQARTEALYAMMQHLAEGMEYDAGVFNKVAKTNAGVRKTREKMTIPESAIPIVQPQSSSGPSTAAPAGKTVSDDKDKDSQPAKPEPKAALKDEDRIKVTGQPQEATDDFVQPAKGKSAPATRGPKQEALHEKLASSNSFAALADDNAQTPKSAAQAKKPTDIQQRYPKLPSINTNVEKRDQEVGNASRPANAPNAPNAAPQTAGQGQGVAQDQEAARGGGFAKARAGGEGRGFAEERGSSEGRGRGEGRGKGGWRGRGRGRGRDRGLDRGRGQERGRGSGRGQERGGGSGRGRGSGRWMTSRARAPMNPEHQATASMPLPPTNPGAWTQPLPTSLLNPAATNPAATNPAATNPAATNPAATNPAATNPAATSIASEPSRTMAQVVVDPPKPQIQAGTAFMKMMAEKWSSEERAVKKSKVPDKKKMETAAAGKIAEPGTPKARTQPGPKAINLGDLDEQAGPMPKQWADMIDDPANAADIVHEEIDLPQAGRSSLDMPPEDIIGDEKLSPEDDLTDPAKEEGQKAIPPHKRVSPRAPSIPSSGVKVKPEREKSRKELVHRVKTHIRQTPAGWEEFNKPKEVEEEKRKAEEDAAAGVQPENVTEVEDIKPGEEKEPEPSTEASWQSFAGLEPGSQVPSRRLFTSAHANKRQDPMREKMLGYVDTALPPLPPNHPHGKGFVPPQMVEEVLVNPEVYKSIVDESKVDPGCTGEGSSDKAPLEMTGQGTPVPDAQGGGTGDETVPSATEASELPNIPQQPHRTIHGKKDFEDEEKYKTHPAFPGRPKGKERKRLREAEAEAKAKAEKGDDGPKPGQ